MLVDPPDGVHPGLFRVQVIETFHENLSRWAPPAGSPLQSIQYTENKFDGKPVERFYFARLVADTLKTTNIYSLFGLNYSQLMDLSFYEWSILANSSTKNTENPNKDTV